MKQLKRSERLEWLKQLKLSKRSLCLTLFLLLAGSSLLAYAQVGSDLDLSWWTVDGGGDEIAGGGFTLTGSVGQPEPGPTLSGGDFTLSSGFWPGDTSAPACDVPLTGVSLSGPSSGDTGDTLTFAANVAPSNASTPVDYTWSTDGLTGGQGSAQATYRWTNAGDKSVQVTARNCGGQDFDANQTVTINGTCAQPLDGVSINGQDTGFVDVDYPLTALPDPSDATPPLTYTWSTDGLVSGQSTPDAVYRWATTGVHTASVTVANCGGPVGAEHAITLSETPLTCTQAITGVTIGGPATGEKDTDYIFSATVAPADATPPIQYNWSTDGLTGGQGSAQATYRWSQTGEYQVAVSTGNCGGSANDTHDVSIGGAYLYLPLVLRDH